MSFGVIKLLSAVEQTRLDVSRDTDAVKKLQFGQFLISYRSVPLIGGSLSC